MSSNAKIQAVIVTPLGSPKIMDIDSSLESLQKIVGGYIEIIRPYKDPVALIVNEEGKALRLPLNRAIYNKNGDICDIIAGTFIVVGTGEEDLTSLPDDLALKYTRLFSAPERFARVGERIVVIK